MNKGLLDEIGSPGLYNSSLYEFMPIFRSMRKPCRIACASR
jgi:hypothetical protein